MPNRNYILTAEAAQHKLSRLALEIAEHLAEDESPLVIIGVLHHGMVIAEKITALVKQHLSLTVELISMEMNKDLPVDIVLSKEVDFTGKNVIIVDDVTNSGKTLLYALKPLLDYHPKRVQTLVLVERMHKLYPVKSDYVGLSIATTLQDHICVEVENGEVRGAYVV